MQFFFGILSGANCRKHASREPPPLAMCRFCEAIGPICRYITDPEWMYGSPETIRFLPPYPDDLLADISQTTVSQAAGLHASQRPRTTRPKAAARRKPRVKTGASRPKPAVFPVRLHWPALASGTHRRLRTLCQVHKVPELLQTSGSRLLHLRPAY